MINFRCAGTKIIRISSANSGKCTESNFGNELQGILNTKKERYVYKISTVGSKRIRRHIKAHRETHISFTWFTWSYFYVAFVRLLCQEIFSEVNGLIYTSNMKNCLFLGWICLIFPLLTGSTLHFHYILTYLLLFIILKV